MDKPSHYCEGCRTAFRSEGALQGHMRSRRHLNVVAGSVGVNYCFACAANIPRGGIGWAAHIEQRTHHRKSERQGREVDAEPGPAQDTPHEKYCQHCRVMVQPDVWSNHEQNPEHKAKKLFAKYEEALLLASLPKHGIAITGDFDFGCLEPSSGVVSEGKPSPIFWGSIQMTSTFFKARLARVQLRSMEQQNPTGAWLATVTHFSVSIVEANWASIALSPHQSLAFNIAFKAKQIGRYEDTIEFIFEDPSTKERWIVAQDLKSVVGSADAHDMLKPGSQFKPSRNPKRKPIHNFVPGIRPPALDAIPYTGRLPAAPIPPLLSALLSDKDKDKDKEKSEGQLLQQLEAEFFPTPLFSHSYREQFKNLLWIEEYQAEIDLTNYDIPNASLTREGRFYCLDVPGLAERRPSVMVGDSMLVQPKTGQETDKNRWFQGHVHFVRRDEVGLCFHDSFRAVYEPTRRYHVRFRLNQIPQRRQHQALDNTIEDDRLLFPYAPQTPVPENLNLHLLNLNIGSNLPQLTSVNNIVSSPPGSPPFIVFGPPGTGKTVTIVEAIRQILITNPAAKILACAPSNSAADLIALRLALTAENPLGLPNDQIFRFYAPSRSFEQVPNELLPFIFRTSEGHFSVPSMEKMLGFRVIVTTCISASVAHGIGMPRGHFSHIFVDEAGQASEPEVFVGIGLMADATTNVVLSGDPKQLGPIIRSPFARALKLQRSYLERLMAMDTYHLSVNQRSIVKLKKNFRSHNTILNFPNSQFYDGELEACGSPEKINAFINSPLLPNGQFPIIFHSVPGQDEREGKSPSFFNPDEILQVKDYVEHLKGDTNFQTVDDDIGIIAPYHAQCVKLRAALRDLASGVKIGSVEEFQGQERKIIIISTVRSSRDFIEFDLKHTLGFVANPRRFNVAVTRAQALLVIVGDPLVLSLDPLWRKFLNYIHLNGGWVGPDIPWNPQEGLIEGTDYAEEIRRRAEVDMMVFTGRMSAFGSTGADDSTSHNPSYTRRAAVSRAGPSAIRRYQAGQEGEVFTADVEIGPMAWDHDIIHQVRSLVAQVTLSGDVPVVILARQCHDPRFVVATFASNLEAIRFVNDWHARSPVEYAPAEVHHATLEGN